MNIPGQSDKKQEDKTITVDPQNWNKFLAYEFSIREAGDDGTVTEKYAKVGGSFVGPPKPGDKVVKTRLELYIPPQALSIQTQFATSVTATNAGFVEEHNGVVFRTISISGNTGVFPVRKQEAEKPTGLLGLLSAIFPGAAAAVGGVLKAGLGVIGAATALGNQIGSYFGEKPKADNGFIADGKNDDKGAGAPDKGELLGTGYYMFWDLYNFFVNYTEGKKKKENKKWRLVFESKKDNTAYVVTPISFDLRRDARSPLTYNYSIVMRAWKLAKATSGNAYYLAGTDIRNPSLVKGLLEIIRRARKTIQKAEGVLKGFQSDISDMINVTAQIHMAAKDAKGLAVTLLDLPAAIKSNAASIYKYNNAQMDAVNKKLKNNPSYKKLLTKKFPEGDKAGAKIADAAKNPYKIPQAIGDAVTDVAYPIVGAMGVVLGSETEAGYVDQLSKIGTKENPGISDSGGDDNQSSPTGEDSGSGSDETGDGGVSGGSDSPASFALADDIFSDPESADFVEIQNLNLPPEVQSAIQKAFEEAKSINAGQVLEAAKKLQELSTNVVTKMDLENPEFLKKFLEIYGLTSSSAGSAGGTATAPISTSQPVKGLSEEDIIMLSQIQDALNALIALTVSTDIFKNLKVDPYAAIANAGSDDQDWTSPTSGIPIFVRTGDTLQKIAKVNLGDEGRAQSIAILNELRAPYIDEKGFTLPIKNATKNYFSIDPNDNITKGQKIYLSGTGLSSSRRTIVEIEKTDKSWKITVDGASNLDVFNLTTSPYLKTRLPGTVGPGDVIFLPSDTAPDLINELKPTNLLNKLSNAEKIFGVDIGLGTDGDILVNSSGDVSMSYGYANAIQVIRNAVEIEQGSLSQHPDHGLPPDIIGKQKTQVTIQDIKKNIEKTLIKDPRFKDVNVSVGSDGQVVRVRIEVTGAGGTGIIPIEYQITV